MNTKSAWAMLEKMSALNELPRRKGKGRNLNSEDFLTKDQVLAFSTKPALNDWSDSSVFIRVETLVFLYSTLTKKGKKMLCHNEMIGGWFEDEEARFGLSGEVVNSDEVSCDCDGQFCSTPCHDEEVPSLTNFREAIESCCTNEGIIFLY